MRVGKLLIVRWAENLARACVGPDGNRECKEALNFLDSFCFVFLIKEKNESLSGRTNNDL